MAKRGGAIRLALILGVLIGAVVLMPGAPRAQAPPAAGPALNITQDTFANLAQQTAGAVVNISSEREVQTGLEKLPNRQMLEHFFGPLPKTVTVHSLGSGLIMDSQGYVLTNNHVVDNAQEIKVILAGGDEYKAIIKGRDPVTDLALIGMLNPPANLPFLKLGDSEAMRVGDWVVAVGNPFGLGHTVTQGIISAKGRVIGAGPYDKFLQTDALINPGNSGGPLLNLQGEVIGINTMILATGQGIGFAIPSNIAKAVAPQLQEQGRVVRGMIGVVGKQLTPELAQKLKLPNVAGALVVKVEPGSPAARAGLRPGDVITDFNGQPVKHMDELSRLVAESAPGSEATVTVLRQGRETKFHLKIAEYVYKSKDLSQ